MEWNLLEAGKKMAAVQCPGVRVCGRAVEEVAQLDGHLPVVLPQGPGTQGRPWLEDGPAEQPWRDSVRYANEDRIRLWMTGGYMSLVTYIMPNFMEYKLLRKTKNC